MILKKKCIIKKKVFYSKHSISLEDAFMKTIFCFISGKKNKKN